MYYSVTGQVMNSLQPWQAVYLGEGNLRNQTTKSGSKAGVEDASQPWLVILYEKELV